MTKEQALIKIRKIASMVLNSTNNTSRRWVKVAILHIYKPQLSINAQHYQNIKKGLHFGDYTGSKKDSAVNLLQRLAPFKNESKLTLEVVDDNGVPREAVCYSAPKYCDVQDENNLVKFVSKNYSDNQTAYVKLVNGRLFTDIKREI